MSTPNPNCKHCQKSSLSLLLLRPSPIATLSTLQPPGASGAVADGALVNPWIPAGLTESRPALRLLRAGYVHLHIPKTNKWLVYSVTDRGELLEQHHPNFGDAKMPSCRRDGHSAAGFKLLSIPDAHDLIGESIWLAFSANLWNAKLKNQNKANPQAMVEVKLGSAVAPAPAFKPTAQAIQSQLLEAKVSQWRLPKLANVGPMFPFASLALAGQVEQLAKTLVDAAAGHSDTKGHELAVVLPDPVGYAAELNALRLARFEMAQNEMAQSKYAHPIMSMQMLEGLRQVVVDSNEAKSYEAVSPIMQKRRFHESLRSVGGRLPDDARWVPLEESYQRRRAVRTPDERWGRVVFVDHDERAQRWATEAAKRNWARYRKYVNEDLLTQERQRIDTHFQDTYGKALARADADWWAAREWQKFNDYFATHFDENDPNPSGPGTEHSPGACYTQEVCHALTPQPMRQGEVLEKYLNELRAQPTDTKAVMLRALAGNQSTVLKALQEYALGPQGSKNAQGNTPYAANQEETSRSDKLHDLVAGLLKGADQSKPLGRHHIKYSWLLHAAYGANSLALVQALTASWAVSAGVKATLAGMAASGGKGPAGDALLSRLERMLMAKQAMLMVTNSAVKSKRLEVPVRFKARVPLHDAIDAQRQITQAGQTHNTSEESLRRAAHRNQTVLVDIVSTNLALREANGDVLSALGSGRAQIALGAAVGSAGLGVPVVNLSRSQFAKLMSQQSNHLEKALVATREAVQGVKGAGLSLDGHIGLLAFLLNGAAVYQTLNSKDAKWSDTGTLLGFTDSVMGTIGGLALIAEAAFTASVAARAGAKAAEQSLWVMGAKALASGAGAFGGMATAAGQFVKVWKEEDPTKQALYGFSGGFFAGQGTTNLLQFGGAFSNFMIRRGNKAAVFRVLAGAATSAEGYLMRGGLLRITGIGLTGWGLVFLAGGLLFEVGVILLTPDALQKHVQNSYFGQDGNANNKYKTLADEEKGLRDLIDPVQPPLEPDVVGNMEIDPMMVAP